MERFQDRLDSDRDRISETESKSRVSCPSECGTRRSKVINGRCNRCLSDSSPVIVTTLMCSHKFCVKCFLYIWSYQKPREPCICPIDGEKLMWLRTASPYVPEHLNALVCLYNRLYNSNVSPRNMTWLFYVDTAFCLVGLIAYCIKIS